MSSPEPEHFKFWMSCYFRTYSVFFAVTFLALVTAILNVVFVRKDEARKKTLGIVDGGEVLGGN